MTVVTAYQSATTAYQVARSAESVVPEVPRPRVPVEETLPVGGLHQRVTYPDSGTALLTVTGPVDVTTAPRLAEMLQSRLCSQLRRVVLDLSGVGFLGVAGVRTLVVAELRARSSETEFLVVCGGNRESARALSATAGMHPLRLHAGPAASALVGDGGYWARCPHPHSRAAGPQVARGRGHV